MQLCTCTEYGAHVQSPSTCTCICTHLRAATGLCSAISSAQQQHIKGSPPVSALPARLGLKPDRRSSRRGHGPGNVITGPACQRTDTSGARSGRLNLARSTALLFRQRPAAAQPDLTLPRRRVITSPAFYCRFSSFPHLSLSPRPPSLRSSLSVSPRPRPHLPCPLVFRRHCPLHTHTHAHSFLTLTLTTHTRTHRPASVLFCCCSSLPLSLSLSLSHISAALRSTAPKVCLSLSVSLCGGAALTAAMRTQRARWPGEAIALASAKPPPPIFSRQGQLRLFLFFLAPGLPESQHFCTGWATSGPPHTLRPDKKCTGLHRLSLPTPPLSPPPHPSRRAKWQMAA